MIPTNLRKKYKIKKVSRIVVIDNDDSIILRPMIEQYLKGLQGSLKGKGGLKILINERQKERM